MILVQVNEAVYASAYVPQQHVTNVSPANTAFLVVAVFQEETVNSREVPYWVVEADLGPHESNQLVIVDDTIPVRINLS